LLTWESAPRKMELGLIRLLITSTHSSGFIDNIQIIQEGFILTDHIWGGIKSYALKTYIESIGPVLLFRCFFPNILNMQIFR
jgi:hypothetical protein